MLLDLQMRIIRNQRKLITIIHIQSFIQQEEICTGKTYEFFLVYVKKFIYKYSSHFKSF